MAGRFESSYYGSQLKRMSCPYINELMSKSMCFRYFEMLGVLLQMKWAVALSNKQKLHGIQHGPPSAVVTKDHCCF